MFEIAKRYSEQQYYRKEDIEKEMDYHVVAPIWEEVQQYRFIFRKEYPIFQCYLIHNPCLMHKLMKTQHALTQYVLQAKQERAMDRIPKEIYSLYSAYIDRSYHLQKDVRWFIDCVNVLEIRIKDEVLSFLCEEDIPFLIRLFFLHHSYDDRSLLVLFLIKEGCPSINAIVSSKSAQIEKDGQDATFSLLHFLHEIWLHISTEMVAQASFEHEDSKYKSVLELKEMYPILNENQIRFYVDHRQAQRYYTITQYMEYAHVCYETARSSMERFVHLHWYQKEKVGKKFIYKVF